MKSKLNSQQVNTLRNSVGDDEFDELPKAEALESLLQISADAGFDQHTAFADFLTAVEAGKVSDARAAFAVWSAPEPQPEEPQPQPEEPENILTAAVAENPRNAGTHGHRSMAVLIAAGPEGLTRKQFREAGGRARDLIWDLRRGRVAINGVVPPVEVAPANSPGGPATRQRLQAKVIKLEAQLAEAQAMLASLPEDAPEEPS